jgi:hypothetical protein
VLDPRFVSSAESVHKCLYLFGPLFGSDHGDSAGGTPSSTSTHLITTSGPDGAPQRSNGARKTKQTDHLLTPTRSECFCCILLCPNAHATDLSSLLGKPSIRETTTLHAHKARFLHPFEMPNPSTTLL